jgi:hypothetical protein
VEPRGWRDDPAMTKVSIFPIHIVPDRGIPTTMAKQPKSDVLILTIPHKVRSSSLIPEHFVDARR